MMEVDRSGCALFFVIALSCAACDDACKQIASQLRECCAKGPAELRKGCEEEAQRLDDDGNEKACQAAIDRGSFERCDR